MDNLGIIAGVLGIFMLIMGIWIISRRNNCNTVIQGMFLNHNDYSVNSVSSYAPVFKYYYNGIYYERQSFDVIPRKLANTYVSGYTYPIYINPNKPNDFVVNRKRKVGDVCMFGFAVLFILFAIIYIYMN